jgi:protein involved in polysaccharide export with SLBB domain
VFVDLTDLERNPNSANNLVLHNHDEVFVRQIPNWQLQDVVEIKGEVRFPGRYALENKKETLSNIIKRAGGLTRNAFLRGGRLFRKSQGLVKPVVDPRDKSLLSVQEEPGTTRLVVNFVAALDRPGSAEDPILSNGDTITIPTTPSEVQVSGEVLTPGSITWVENKDVYYYIGRTGGLTANADAGAIHIIRANGESLKGNSRIEIGDTIVVLPRNKEDKTDWGAILRDAVAVTASLTTIVLLILQFNRR